MESLRLGSRAIGPSEPPYVIAEIGSNHNGDMGLCRDLIAAAAECGAHAAKFQSWSEKSLISKTEYERNTSYGDKHRHFGSLREMVRAYQLTPDQHERAASMCAEHGIHFLSSAFSPTEVEMLADLDVPAIKIASMDVNYTVLLEAAASTGLPILLSTGMATFAEVARAFEIVDEETDCVVLHCVSLYPVDPLILNLRNIPTLQRAFGCVVGFSDHSLGSAAAVTAVALGSSVIEKHFTIDKKLPGWDHWMSAEPDELRALCDAVAQAHQALGSPQRQLTPEELKKRDSFRRSIVAARELKEGDTLMLEDLDFKRPGTGIRPDQARLVVGRKARHRIEKEALLTWDDLL